MKLLFIHQNFPGQYLRLVQHLCAVDGHEIVGIGEEGNIKNRGALKGITTIAYKKPQGAGKETHHYLQSTEAAVRRGQAVARTLIRLKESGFVPDVISVHPGWGEGLFVRDIFPQTPVLMFCEFFFQPNEADMCFDPEFPGSPDAMFALRIKNAPQLVSLSTANALVSPTAWQASRYPRWLRSEMLQIHDGIDTDYMRPDNSALLRLRPLPHPEESRIDPQGPLCLSRKNKIVTFVVRNIEPYRGAHIFLRALPDLQRLHPDAHILIVGGNEVSYSQKPPEGQSYKEFFLQEVKDRLDFSRIHFLGRIPYSSLRDLFRISSAHVYLTYPFVLSWSVLEAMSCECLVIASGTEPVLEVLRHEENGLLVDFFKQEELIASLDKALSRPQEFVHVRKAARQTILQQFGLADCLGRQTDLLHALASGVYPQDAAPVTKNPPPMDV